MLTVYHRKDYTLQRTTQDEAAPFKFASVFAPVRRLSHRNHDSHKLTLSQTAVGSLRCKSALCSNRILFVSDRFIVAIVYSLCGTTVAPGNILTVQRSGNRTPPAGRLVDICFCQDARETSYYLTTEYVC
jgi:hypothetical protein